MPFEKRLWRFFDRLEDAIRGHLSRYPILYAFFGSIAIVLLWRGVWLMADALGVSGLTSFVLGAAVLLATGLFTSFFVGDSILISGIRNEKKLIEKTEEEVSEEGVMIASIKKEIQREGKDLEAVRREIAEIKKLIRRNV